MLPCTWLSYPADSALRARIKSYELAFRMRWRFPEVFGSPGKRGDAKPLRPGLKRSLLGYRARLSR